MCTIAVVSIQRDAPEVEGFIRRDTGVSGISPEGQSRAYPRERFLRSQKHDLAFLDNVLARVAARQNNSLSIIIALASDTANV